MSSPSSPDAPQRLFLALWPEDAERQSIADLAAQVAGQQRVRDADLHLTLAFLGATSADRLAAYQAALANLPELELDLLLDRYGYWPRPRILWLGPSQTPPILYARVAELHRRLRDCGFIPEARAFQAHITLARRYPGPAPAQSPVMPVRWLSREVALVESLREGAGTGYRVLRRWPEH